MNRLPARRSLLASAPALPHDPRMINLGLAALAFTGIHLGVSGTTIRDRLVAALGLRGYMILFSVLSVATIAWLVGSYKVAPYIETWGQPEWWKPVAIVLMLPAFMLVVVGLATPNPTSVQQESLVDQPPRGIVRITRHPFLVGTALWAATHVVSNGDAASLLFFGALFVVGAAGTVSIDAKRRRSLGPAAWDAFARRTSILPFVAVLQGRNTLAWPEIGALRLSAGMLVYALMLGGHAHIIGVSPWPHW